MFRYIGSEVGGFLVLRLLQGTWSSEEKMVFHQIRQRERGSNKMLKNKINFLLQCSRQVAWLRCYLWSTLLTSWTNRYEAVLLPPSEQQREAYRCSTLPTGARKHWCLLWTNFWKNEIAYLDRNRIQITTEATSIPRLSEAAWPGSSTQTPERYLHYPGTINNLVFVCLKIKGNFPVACYKICRECFIVC